MGISQSEHNIALKALGWTSGDFLRGNQEEDGLDFDPVSKPTQPKKTSSFWFW